MRGTVPRRLAWIRWWTAIATVAVLGTPGAQAQVEPDEDADPTPVQSEGDRVAYVTPGGEVVVAEGDGANPRIIGTGAVSNRHGLAPLAWRQPATDAVAYVRSDRALVVASTEDGVEPQILATDAVVPDDADSDILSWDISGSLLVYLAEPEPGRVEARVVDLTAADSGGEPEIRTIGDPFGRRVLAQAFSPLDPIIYQKTADADTGQQLTVSIVEPLEGTVFGTDYSLDDVTFTPDGRYVFAVARGTTGIEQMVRIDLRRPTSVELVTDRDRICRPSVSPDAKLIVFASGPDCDEVWTIRSNGTEPRRILSDVADGATFEVGGFSWSEDSTVISHPLCRRTGGGVACGGAYLDMAFDGDSVDERAAAGSVLRPARPLLRPVKLEVMVDGPIGYIGEMQVGYQSVGDILAQRPQEVVRAKGVDENDGARSFEIVAVHPVDSEWLGGTLRVIDGDFDETFPFFGRLQPSSLGFAKLRGIWTRSQAMPMQSGQLTITLSR